MKAICPICERRVMVRARGRDGCRRKNGPATTDPGDVIAKLINERGCSKCLMAGRRVGGGNEDESQDSRR